MFARWVEEMASRLLAATVTSINQMIHPRRIPPRFTCRWVQFQALLNP
jgi:hypothetical protein